MDEYVGNEWPGVAAPMPRHGHHWIDIQQKERGQAPMIDIAYVPTMCNHCDNAPCLAKGGRRGASEARRRHRHHRSGEGQGPQGPRRSLPLRPHLVERGVAASADLAVRRASARPGLAADPRPAGLPDRRDARDQGRGRRDGAHGARRKPRSDEAGGRHEAARLLPQPVALQRKLHRRQRRGRGGRRGRLRRGRERAADQGRPDGRRAPPPTTTATSNSTSSTRTPAATPSRSPASAAPRCSTPRSASASFLGEIRL